MKNRPTMDIRLRMIQELYEGEGSVADRLREEQPDVMNEFESMRSLKSALDARPPRRPDRSTIDAVLTRAANAFEGQPSDEPSDESSLQRRQDRKPRARRGVYLRSAGVATAVVTVLIAVTTVWQADLLEDVSTPAGDPTVEEPAVSQRASPQESSPGHGVDDRKAAEERSAATESRLGATGSGGVALAESDLGDDDVDHGVDAAAVRDAADVNHGVIRTYRPVDSGYVAAMNQFSGDPTSGRRPSDILPIGVRPQTSRVFYDETSSEDLAWDQVADVVEMYQQIEMIEEGVARGWEPPSVPLEMVPSLEQQRGSSIRPAGDRRVP